MGVFRLFAKLFNIFGRFRFGWDFSTGAVFGDCEPLEVNFAHSKGTSLRQTTVFEPPYVKIRCELRSVGELTKQEEEKSKKNRESVIV